MEAINKYGILKGSIKSIYRIMRCNPFNKGGYDPVKWEKYWRFLRFEPDYRVVKPNTESDRTCNNISL